MSGAEIALGALAAVSAVGTLAAGEQAADANEANAAMARQRGEMAMETANSQAEIQARNNKRAMAEMVAAYGASGVELTGSPLDVLWDQTRERKLAEEMIRYRGKAGQVQAENEASLYEFSASGARTSSYFGAATTLLGAAYVGSQLPASSGASPNWRNYYPADAGPTFGPFGKAGLRPY